MEKKEYKHFAVTAKTKDLYDDVEYLMKKSGEKVTQDLALYKALKLLKNEIEETLATN